MIKKIYSSPLFKETAAIIEKPLSRAKQQTVTKPSLRLDTLLLRSLDQKALMLNRQLPDAATGNGENRIAHRGCYRWQGWLA